jgi:hypothetical protein
MRLILPTLADPTDVIIAGMMSLEPASALDMPYTPVAYRVSSAASPMAGYISTAELPMLPFPRVPVHPMAELFASSQSQDLIVTPVGVQRPQTPVPRVFVNPQIACALPTATLVGPIGGQFDLEIEEPPENSRVLTGPSLPELGLPRKEQLGKFAGERKRIDEYKFKDVQRRGVAWFGKASERYTFTGTTEDGLSGSVAGVSLYLLETARLGLNEAWPRPTSTVSDGSFSITAPRNTEYALVALKAGSPPLMGGRGPGLAVGTYSALTAAGNSATSLGVVIVRDPTASVSGGGGVGRSRAGSGLGS